MERIAAEYQAALQNVEESITRVIAEPAFFSGGSAGDVEKIDSNLDGWDYCYAIAIGLAGVFISTNEAFSSYLDQIHKAASGANGEYDRFQTFLGNVLHHKGDHIDLMEDAFINRDKHHAFGLFHRLLWGHDILDMGEDNPFKLMYKQNGLQGILQAVRHLLADTMSKQGLPLPGSSFLDMHDGNGKRSNYLIRIAQTLSNETYGVKTKAHEIYAHMMTIRAQDIAAGVVVKSMSELYFLMRGIDDKIRRVQIKLIAYTVNFLGEAVVGGVRQQGIPYINVPLAGMMVNSFANLWHLEKKEVKQLQKDTDRLTEATAARISSFDPGEMLLTECTSADDYICAYDQAEANVDELLDYFGGDSK